MPLTETKTALERLTAKVEKLEIWVRELLGDKQPEPEFEIKYPVKVRATTGKGHYFLDGNGKIVFELLRGYDTKSIEQEIAIAERVLLVLNACRFCADDVLRSTVFHRRPNTLDEFELRVAPESKENTVRYDCAPESKEKTVLEEKVVQKVFPIVEIKDLKNQTFNDEILDGHLPDYRMKNNKSAVKQSEVKQLIDDLSDNNQIAELKTFITESLEAYSVRFEVHAVNELLSIFKKLEEIKNILQPEEENV